MTIVEFLEARLAEDEAVAREAITPYRPGTHWEWESTADDDDPESPRWLRTVEEFPTTSGVGDLPGFPLGYDCKAEPSPAMDHIARHDPARALAEVAAKRGILEAHAGRSPRSSDFCRICEDPYTYGPEAWPCDTVRYLASTYKDHPDFNKHTEGGWTI